LKITIEMPSRYNFQRGVNRTREIIVAGVFSFFLPEPEHPGVDGHDHRAKGHMEIDSCLQDQVFRMLAFLRSDSKT